METLLYQNRVYRVIPCPNCHKADRLAIEIHDGCHAVCCGHCTNLYRGAYAGSPEMAVKKWNAGKSWEDE